MQNKNSFNLVTRQVGVFVAEQNMHASFGMNESCLTSHGGLEMEWIELKYFISQHWWRNANTWRRTNTYAYMGCLWSSYHWNEPCCMHFFFARKQLFRWKWELSVDGCQSFAICQSGVENSPTPIEFQRLYMEIS